MIRLAAIGDGGKIVASALASSVARAEAALQGGGHTNLIAVPLDTDARLHWIVDGERADRPTVAAPPALTAGVSADWTLPEGSMVTVDPLNGAAPLVETVEGVFTLGLPAGVWKVSVNPPFPFRSAEWLIEVSA